MNASGTSRLNGHAARLRHLGLQALPGHVRAAHQAAEERVHEVRHVAAALARRPGGGVCADAPTRTRPAASRSAAAPRPLTPAPASRRPARKPAHRVERPRPRAREAYQQARHSFAACALAQQRHAAPRPAGRASSPDAVRRAAELEALADPAAVVDVEEGAAGQAARSRRRASASPEAREVALGAAQVRVAPLQLAAAGSRGPRRSRVSTGSGNARLHRHRRAVRVGQRQHALQRPEVRPAQPHPHVHPLRARACARARASRAPRAARACEPGDARSRASWRSASPSSSATVATSRPACPDLAGPRRAHQAAVRHQQREVPARRSRARSRRGRRAGRAPSP